MVKSNRRRPSSASPTPRPRRIAGRTDSTPPSADEPASPDQSSEDAGPAEWAPVRESTPEPQPEPEPEFATESEPLPSPAEATDEVGFVGSPKTTRVLLVAIVVLAVVALAGGIFLWVEDDYDEPSTATDTGSVIAADDETPVRIADEDARVAVAAAATAAHTIVATSYRDYDAQVEEAAELMTPAFAEQYRQTAGDVEAAIVESKTEVQVQIVAQGVVRADQEEVQALVFLNQLVNKAGKDPVYTAYRAMVTVVNTDQGWLVSDLETK
jgi:Mce-associated membrane protein